MNVVICKEEAQNQVLQFMEAWGIRDKKAILTGNKESSIPEEVMETILVSVMCGETTFPDSGKKVCVKFRDPIENLDEVVFCRKAKVHNFNIGSEPDPIELAAACTDVPSKKFHSLTMQDFSTVMSISTLLLF